MNRLCATCFLLNDAAVNEIYTLKHILVIDDDIPVSYQSAVMIDVAPFRAGAGIVDVASHALSAGFQAKADSPRVVP